MSEAAPAIALPPNARVGEGSVITADALGARAVFQRFRSQRDPALIIGGGCLIDGVSFNLGPDAIVEIGHECHLQDAFLLSEAHIKIGDRVTIGWHATIVDSDFHPLALDQRIADAVALSPEGKKQNLPRPACVSRAILIADDVWIGPNAMVLKGVSIGQGAMIEPGAVVTRDVPSGARVMGNPARVVEDET